MMRVGGPFSSKENWVYVVRCKDCKYWAQQLGNYKGDAYGCCGRLTTRPYDFDMTADDFCSRGERK